MSDQRACRICAVSGNEEFCSDEHTDKAVRLAEALGKMIWGDDPCPDENLATHVEDAVLILAHTPWFEEDAPWKLNEDAAEQLGIDWSTLNDFMAFYIDGRIFGHNPNEEGECPPRPLDELLALRL